MVLHGVQGLNISMIPQLSGASLPIYFACDPFPAGVIIIVRDVFSLKNLKRMPITLRISRQYKQQFIQIMVLFYMSELFSSCGQRRSTECT